MTTGGIIRGEEAGACPDGMGLEVNVYIIRRIGGREIVANVDQRAADGRPLLALTRSASRLAPFASKRDAIATLAWFAQMPELAIGHALDGLLTHSADALSANVSKRLQ